MALICTSRCVATSRIGRLQKKSVPQAGTSAHVSPWPQFSLMAHCWFWMDYENNKTSGMKLALSKNIGGKRRAGIRSAHCFLWGI